MSTAGQRCRRGDVICSALSIALSVALYASTPTAHAQASAQTEAVQQYDIPAGPLSKALSAWGAQSGKQLVFPPDLVAGKTSKGVSGRYASGEALTRLLSGSGVAWEVMGDSTVVLKKVPDPSKAPASKLEQRTEAAETKEEVTELETIVVTGTHIRGAVNATAPVTILDREYIDSTGVATTVGLVESLPQNLALANQSAITTPGVTNQLAQGSSINLRGLGEGTTLVLLNGRRLPLGFTGSAVDISALPLSAIERVEVLPDGASALYGSDAVGGAVNFVLRRDFEGAETRLRAGFSNGGVNEYRANQTFGTSWATGNILASAEYYFRDILRARDRDFVAANSPVGSLRPEDEVYSFMLTGHQELSSNLTFFADALYSNRQSYNEAGQVAFNETSVVDNPQLSTTAGLTWSLADAWQVEGFVGYASNDLHQALTRTGFNRRFDSTFTSTNAHLKLDGTFLHLPGGNARLALGAEWRSEDFEAATQTPTSVVGAAAEQTVRSVFAEVYVPIIGDGNALPLLRRLELSLAARYEDYSSFGSSVDPRIGIMWQPIRGLSFRAAFGTSYRAPKLSDYSAAGNIAVATFATDQLSPSGRSYVLSVSGNDPSLLQAEESKNLSFGVDFTPPALPGFRLSLNYFDIEFVNRISNPSFAFTNPVGFESLVTRDPTIDQVNALIAFGRLGQGFLPFNDNFTPNTAFTPDQIDVVLDRRRRNLSEVRTRGLDFSIGYDIDIRNGVLSLGVDGTYVFEFDTRATPTSSNAKLVNTLNNPPDLRLRGSARWQRGNWSASAFVNYVVAYTDARLTTPVEVSSYSTTDARISYSFTGPLAGTTLAVAVSNLSDEDPPALRVLTPASDLGFDPVFANPIGRLVSIELTKRW